MHQIFYINLKPLIFVCRQLDMLLFSLCMYVGVQADIHEGKFVPKAPVIAVEDIHSSAIVKVFIASKYI